MKITIELNGVKQERQIPLNWDQVNFEQFLKLVKAGDDIAEILSIFTGVEPDILRKATIQNLEVIINLLSFLKTDFEPVVPEKCLGYDIPKNLEFESIGQFQDLKLEALEMKEDISRYTLFCAIYATKPYDFKEAEKKKDEFLKAPAREVVGIGNFTLLKLVELMNGIKNNSLPQSTPTKRFKRVLIVWLRNLDFTLRYYIWKRKLRIKGTRY
jgi:hypothetical protein